MVKSHGSYHMNDQPHNSRKFGVALQQKLTKKSSLTTAIISQIRKCFPKIHIAPELTINIEVHGSKFFLYNLITESQTNGQNGRYCPSNGKFLTSAYQQPFTTTNRNRIIEGTCSA